MDRVQVIFKINTSNLPEDFPAILKHEQAVLAKWGSDGILEHLFLTQKKDGVVLIFKDLDESKAKELVETLPLYEFKKSIEYLNLVKQF